MSEVSAILVPKESEVLGSGELASLQPMTQQQIEVFLSAENSPDASRAYNLVQTFEFDGLLDVKSLVSAIRQLEQRHDALRTTFYGPGLAACISREFNAEILCLDLSAENLQRQEQEIQWLKKAEVEHCFDLTFGPLFRAKIIRLSPSSHILLTTVHHIIGDGWSLQLLAKELQELYAAKVQGRLPNLPKPYQLSQYNRDQRGFRSTDQFQKVQNYWSGQFKYACPNLELPLPRRRPKSRSYPSQRASLALDGALVHRLCEFGPKNKTTFFTLVYSAYIAFLYRITAQQDLVVGVPYAGQADAGQTHLFGHCVQMLPVRHAVEGSKSFSELLSCINTTMLEARRHGKLSFGELIDCVQIDRDPSRIPIVASTFNLTQEGNRINFDGVECKYYQEARAFETFELAIHVSQYGDRIQIDADYNTDLFDQSTVDRWLSEYVELLRGATENPNQKLSELPLLCAEDRRLLSAWNETEQGYPQAECLHQLIDAQAQRTPERMAVSFGDTEWSYQALNQRANQLAHCLIDKGVGPDVLVGLCVERSADMLVGLLGILKAGGGYLPLDPEYPRERIEFILDNAQAPLLVSQDKLLSAMPEHAGETLSLDGDWDRIATYSNENPPTAVLPEHLAYVIYTSGSTGKPKGVQVSHGNAVNFLCSMQKEPGLSADDKLLAVTTLSFDIAVLELYLPLITGAQVDIASREMTLDAQALSQRIDERGITAMQATPATWRMLLDYGWQGDGQLKALVGGEALPQDIVAGLLANTRELWNMYGPTETTVWSTCCQITDANAPVLIGKPIANTQLYVLDLQGQRVPVGVPGELYIGGDGVTRGYLNRPELNEQAYIDDPYHSRSGMKLYRTGDQVKLSVSGDLQYITRLDNQVKVRGFRIELGEIETVLSSHDVVTQSVVVVREDQPGDVRLVAYYVAMDGVELPSVQALRDHLQQSLPAYMLPQHFMSLEVMPQTPNGKIDRKQLPAPDSSQGIEAEFVVGPRNDFERSILSVWQRALNMPNIGISHNFFEWGGHSLLAVRVINEMEQATGVSFNIGLFFQNPTIKGLVETMGNSTAQQSSNVVLLNKATVEDGEKKAPLFMLCGVDIYQELADTISDRDVYGVYVFGELAIARDAMAGKSSKVSFSALCASYIDAIKRMNPQQGVELGGVSFGGFIAYEVSRLLKEKTGVVVDHVYLLDTVLPSGYQRSVAKYLIHGILANPVSTLARQWMRLKKRVQNKKIVHQAKSLDEHEQGLMLRGKAFTNIMEDNEKILKVSGGPVTLFKAQDGNLPVWVQLGETLGWRRLVPSSLRVVSVPGDHLGILRLPNVLKLTEIILEK